MSPPTIEVTVAMRVRDVAELIDRKYGGLAGLDAHLAKRRARGVPPDTVGVLLRQAGEMNRDADPDSTVHFSEIHVPVGDRSDLLTLPKLQLIGALMGRRSAGLRELARALGKNPATVLAQLEQLEEAGLVVKDSSGPGRPATIRPLIQELTIRVRSPAPA